MQYIHNHYTTKPPYIKIEYKYHGNIFNPPGQPSQCCVVTRFLKTPIREST